MGCGVVVLALVPFSPSRGYNLPVFRVPQYGGLLEYFFVSVKSKLSNNNLGEHTFTTVFQVKEGRYPIKNELLNPPAREWNTRLD